MSKTNVILITIAAWAAGCAYTAYLHVTTVLGPPCITDTYACARGFQLVVFAVCRLPFRLVGLLAVVSLEVVTLKPSPRKLN